MLIDITKTVTIQVKFLENNEYKLSAIKNTTEKPVLETKTFTCLGFWKEDSNIMAYFNELKEKYQYPYTS